MASNCRKRFVAKGVAAGRPVACFRFLEAFGVSKGMALTSEVTVRNCGTGETLSEPAVT